MKQLMVLSLLLVSVAGGAQTLSKKPNYKELNEKIIQVKCIQCHNDNYAARQVYLVNYDDVSSHAVAGKPEESILYEAVTEKAFVRMPMGQAPLSKAEIEYIKAWIKAKMPK